MNLKIKININADKRKNPKCKSYPCNNYFDPIEYACGYDTKIGCDECKYGMGGGKKNPEAKCNQL